MEEIGEIINSIKDCINEYEDSSIELNIKKIITTTNSFGKAWSASWIGYQASVYYRNFGIPSPGDHFNIEWGFQDTFNNPTSQNWVEYSFDTVINEIKRRSGLSIEEIREFDDAAKKIQTVYNDSRKRFIDLIEINYYKTKDSYLEKILNDTTKIKILTQDDILKARIPKQLVTYDTIAGSQGARYPPHISYESYFLSLLSIKQALQETLDQANKYYKYCDSNQSIIVDKTVNASKVFIGHGRSVIWKDLKDFLEKRLDLEWEEFNREPVAGYSNKERLLKMLESSSFAFIVLTAEDLQLDGKINPRLNVVHEVGLFQGKLGFTKAIILLEEGCEEFSNIHGIGQIRFPKNNIEAKYEEIRKVLERENII